MYSGKIAVPPGGGGIGVNNNNIIITRARILGKMDYFYFLRHMYETCL
jgi:hypothetical protein